MGFFQSLKDDLSSAMNELINEENDLETVDADESAEDILDDISEDNLLDDISVDQDLLNDVSFDENELLSDEVSSLEEEYVEEESNISDYVDEPAYDQGILDLLSAEPEKPRSARSAINSLKAAGKRYEQKQLQEAIDNGAVGSIEEEIVEDKKEEVDDILSLLDGTVDSLSDDITESVDDVSEVTAEEDNMGLSEDIDVAKMLDELNLDALDLEAQKMSEAQMNDEGTQLNIEDLLNDLDNSMNNDSINNNESVSEEPISEPEAEPIIESVLEPVPESVTEPVTEPVSEPVIEPASEPVAEPIAEPVEEPVIEPIEEPVMDTVEEAVEIAPVQPEPEKEVVIEAPVIEAPVKKEPVKPQAKPVDTPVLMPNVPAYVPKISNEFSDETAVITKGMRVVGNVASNGNMDVIGTIVGDISIIGKLSVSGTIVGKSKAHEIFADGAEINGDINVTGTVKIGQSSVIIGNISSTSAVIAGAVKGDIDVQGPVVLDSSAIVMGNIKSMSVQINNGAVVEGMCSQCYATVNPTSFFDDFKKTTSLLGRK